MLVSKSGYIITDIYIDLKRCMACHDFERACYWSVELVSSGDIRNLVNWIISLCCNEYITTNAFLYGFIISKLSIMSENNYKWKQDNVKKALCEIIMILSKEEQEEKVIYKPGTNYKPFIDSLYFRKNNRFRELEENMSYVVHNELFILMSYMYEFMLQGDIKSTFKIMYHLIQKNTIDECETLDIVRQVKKNKNDSVWALWKVLMIFTHRPPCDQKTRLYVNNVFSIFASDYAKKVRQERMNILFVAYVVCVKRKPITYHDTLDDIILQASNQVNVIYDEINKSEKKEKEEKKKDAKDINIKRKECNKKTPKTTMTTEEQEQFEQKMRVFFTLTYKNPSTQLHKPIIAPVSQQPCKLVDVNGDELQTDETNKYCIEKI